MLTNRELHRLSKPVAWLRDDYFDQFREDDEDDDRDDDQPAHSV